MTAPRLVPVRLLATYTTVWPFTGYNVGEVVGVSPAEAERLVGLELAELVEPTTTERAP